MKPVINKDFFEKYKDRKVVMHCKTLEEAKAFCKVLYAQNLYWEIDGNSEDKNNWNVYREDTCYNFNHGLYGCTYQYKKMGYEILEYSDFE